MSEAWKSQRDPFGAPSAKRLMIFGHPAHELALFGVLQCYRPDILIITDGGGPERVEQSRHGLRSIGLLEKTRYLNYREASFYEALLDGDIGLFARVTGAIATTLAETKPTQIFCDAVEFYNPVHDVTLPMVRAALPEDAPVPLYEVPLVYQRPGQPVSFHIQRVPDELAERRIVHALTEEEATRKFEARNEIYRNLREQAGPEFLALSKEHLAREEMAVALDRLPRPGEFGRAMRYEFRGCLLQAQGLVERAITYGDHFLPMVRALQTADTVV